MAPTSFSSAGVALLLILAGASLSHGSVEGRLATSDGHGKDAGRSWRRRLLDDSPDAAPPANNSLVLAEERTRRPDPSANYTIYTGGWNITDQHYWASVFFTAVPLVIIAVLWLMGFGVALIIVSCCSCFSRSRNSAYSPGCYVCSLVLLIILTLSTITGCWMLQRGGELFHGSTIDTVDYVSGRGVLMFDNVKNFTSSLGAAKTVRVDEIFLPVDVQKKIDVIEDKLNSAINGLSTKMLEISNKVKQYLDHILILKAVGSVMLGLAILGFLFSILGLRILVSLLVILGWIILAATTASSAVVLLLHNVMEDTCVAMGEWATHPQAHTALSDFLPCFDPTTANESTFRGQEVTEQLVALVNNVIANISNRDFQPALKPLYFNQSGPLMPMLCNPFNPDMSPRACAPGEVDFDSAAQEWKRFECQTAGPPGSEVCVTEGRVTPEAYSQMTAAASISQGVYRFIPFVRQLIDCSLVRDSFTTISVNNCPGLERYSRLIYIGLLVISGAMMLSIIFWMVHTRQQRRRKMCK